MQTVLSEIEQTGVLHVDRTRGKYAQFLVGQYQLGFPPAMFELGPDRCRHLKADGRILWGKCFEYAGKGVTVKGTVSTLPIKQDTFGGFKEQLVIHLTDIVLTPSADPKPPHSRPKPVLPAACVEEDEEKLKEQLAKMSDKEKVAFNERQSYNKQLAEWYKDMTIEEMMDREAI
jgi:hypothetical protein